MKDTNNCFIFPKIEIFVTLVLEGNVHIPFLELIFPFKKLIGQSYDYRSPFWKQLHKWINKHHGESGFSMPGGCQITESSLVSDGSSVSLSRFIHPAIFLHKNSNSSCVWGYIVPLALRKKKFHTVPSL